MVMKSAEDRHRCDATPVLDGAMDRSIFAKRPMIVRIQRKCASRKAAPGDARI
jgi:hypothetical protein